MIANSKSGTHAFVISNANGPIPESSHKMSGTWACGSPLRIWPTSVKPRSDRNRATAANSSAALSCSDRKRSSPLEDALANHSPRDVIGFSVHSKADRILCSVGIYRTKAVKPAHQLPGVIDEPVCAVNPLDILV